MFRHTLFSLVPDTAMLALVCVLECLDLTGLEIHQWLGFVLMERSAHPLRPLREAGITKLRGVSAIRWSDRFGNILIPDN